MSEQKIKDCYEQCNDRYSAMQPQRLFCKKGCDSDQESIINCKTETCNKVCIKEEQGDQKLFFNFLYRAPKHSGPCLSACIFGCNKRLMEDDN